MPKTLFQNVIFTLMMSFLMVYVMICYNICLNVGGMSNEVFLMAFGELKIMWPVAFVLEFIHEQTGHKTDFQNQWCPDSKRNFTDSKNERYPSG